MIQKILVLSDSLALPRLKPEIVSYEETWPFLLRESGYEVIQVSIGGGTSEDLVKLSKYYKGVEPNFVIVQVGIVDCAPRFMTLNEINFTSILGKFGKLLRFLLNRKWVRKSRNISYVKEKKFSQNMSKILSHYFCPALLIGLIPASSGYEEVLPGIGNKIQIYNAILSNNRHFLSLEEIINIGGVMSDYHHLNIKGHSFVHEKIIAYLDDLSQS